jgi:nucleoside-diphosphate-sugar epimerase
MKVFIAGAGGAVGRRLALQLVAAGHEVTAMTRSDAKAGELRALGAEVAIADALARPAVIEAVMRAEPEVVINELTALTGVTDYRRFDRVFAETNRLRTEGTANLVEAAQAAGARRLIAQSYGGWNYARTGTAAKVEDDPFDPSPPANQRESLQAIRQLEATVLGAESIEGIVLRYASFYGPGTNIAADGDICALVRKRSLPLIGDGAGVWSFIHVDDAAAATVLALGRGAPGVYNVGDDEPAPVSRWLPALAEAIGAKPPRHVPVWVGRLAAGDVGVSMMTQIRGISNAKARRELGFVPRYPSYRAGFRDGLVDRAPAGVSARGRA